jgi:hypothetical protein
MKTIFFLSMFFANAFALAAQTVSLYNDTLSLLWNSDGKDWTFNKMTTRWNREGEILRSKGALTILFSATPPDETPVDTFTSNRGTHYIEEKFAYWKEHIKPVMLNAGGERDEIVAFRLLSREPLTFAAESKFGTVTLQWKIAGNEIFVHQVFEAKREGYYSVSTPDIFSSPENEIRRAIVPGYLNADRVSNDFARAYTYGHYIPRIPVVYQDKCVTTPVAILSGRQITVGLAPEPDYPRKPHNEEHNTHHQWKVGYSMMNLQGAVSPTLYCPVLGREQSYMKAGEKRTFDYRYIVSGESWFEVFKQVAYKMYGFEQTRIMKNRQSLTDRVLKMYRYLTDTKTSRFRLAESDGLTIGAQDYMGGVVGSDGDAMKNSDYGAMWMLGALTRDTALLNNVLPYARNFKLKQEYSDDGEWKGAIKGQYYLWKSQSWVEEWGPHIEPMAVTYYAICDLGNLLLFNPGDEEAATNLRYAADYLLKVQKADGSWDIGIDKHAGEAIYQDIEDLRPTFYGLLVAWQILKDEQYLTAAVKGADWFVEHAVNTGQFIGVCGDARFAPDFATAQSAQALLELYGATGEEKYKEAAIRTATFYTTYIYTFPNGQTEWMQQGNQTLPGWGFSQSGLSFEHSGPIGSAAPQGPILLAGFSGLFVRMFTLTGDSLFLDMARAATTGRDAFVDPKTSVASYYWSSFNQGPGPYPHHAWWQIGWIMDYLLAEAALRSKGAITFPQGFISPKAGGATRSPGFAPGEVNGEKAELVLSDHLVRTDNPACEYLTAVSENKLFVILMNSSNQAIAPTIEIDGQDPVYKKHWEMVPEQIELEAYGIKVMEITLKDDFVATVGSPKGFIFITAGQRPAEKKASRENCLKGRTVSRILSPAFQAAETNAAFLYRGSLTHGYENKALRASIRRCNKVYVLRHCEDKVRNNPLWIASGYAFAMTRHCDLSS